ncbi:hypothetical protein SAMN05444487_12140 [Marininema mesophilum]|uniref:Uncharacterized protein n=1 Tax=Marininema mesophilum TaxID=1048340 RepID=A0A1H3CDZ9_9BACL|nr:hypothetical protein [Marininema mesophilum]SDX51814.1 hypothetical protein SAMN05444487_12140 [Marininema mesophilum]
MIHAEGRCVIVEFLLRIVKKWTVVKGLFQTVNPIYAYYHLQKPPLGSHPWGSLTTGWVVPLLYIFLILLQIYVRTRVGSSMDNLSLENYSSRRKDIVIVPQT